MKFIILVLVLALCGCDNKPSSIERPVPSPLVNVTASASHVINHGHDHNQEPHKNDYEHEHEHEPRQTITHKVHNHGAATMQVIAEGQRLIINMNLPSTDAVGFEHIPASETEQKSLADALQVFKSPDSLFVMNAQAHCTLKQGKVNTPLLNTRLAVDEHADFNLAYEWDCAAPASLTSIAINLFKYFATLDKITADYIINTKQASVEITRHLAATLIFK